MINYTMKHKNNIRTYRMIELFPDVGIETKFLQEAWISESDEANQMFMFGVSKQHESFDGFCEVVEKNLPKYKALYQCVKLGEE